MIDNCVAQVRASVSAMLLGAPEQIRSQAVSKTGFSPAGWRELRYWAEASQACSDSPRSLAIIARQALSHLPHLPWADESEAPGAATANSAGRDPHDAYFRVVRVQDPSDAGYLRGLLQALVVFDAETSDPLDAQAYRIIPRSLCALWCDALGVPVADRHRQTLADRPTMRRLTSDPVRRWLRGHQVFAVLTQGLIWSMHQLSRVIHASDHRASAEALGRVQLLLDASAAGFRFTADFDPVHYRDTIRPSMCEPHVPKGFSGTLSADHGHLVRLMSSLRPDLKQLQEQHPAPYAAMSAALAAVYEDHKLVCEHFDGARVASLRGGSHAPADGPSGTEMLDKFKHRRVAMLS